MEAGLTFRPLICLSPLKCNKASLPYPFHRIQLSRFSSGMYIKTQNNETYKLNTSTDNGAPKMNIQNENKLPEATIGRHLARRLVEIGVSDIFSVPGDSNLSLLDYFVAEARLNLVGCCNELNAGYAADGYARSRGVGACVVTFTVGGLSLLNAIAGAYSESLPIICIVGAPNSNDFGSKKILHHTIGLPEFDQELQCFKTVTCHQVVINDLADAQEQIDTAIAICLRESKPVYISISCNLVAIPHFSFNHDPLPLFSSPKMSNQMALELAVETAAELLNKAVKPVMIAGPRLRAAKACDAFMELADSCGYALAVMPSAKSLIPEHHPRFIGTYWGNASSPFCNETVSIADASIFAGPLFDDLSTVGYSLVFNKAKAIIVEPERVLIPNAPVYASVLMKDFFKALVKRLKQSAVRVKVLSERIQKILSANMTVIAEAGDSLFLCQNLSLPRGCGYESQLLYASIGWSIGATLGYAQAALHKRVIACMGDGSFQVGGQEVSTMLRWGQKSIIILINNGGYTTESKIHDGPYNIINNWDYTTFIHAIHNNAEAKCWTAKVHNEEELVEVFETAVRDKKDCLCFIEVIVHKEDCSKQLLQVGCMLAAANTRPPIIS
ncbi:pyruvate decarboxylase 1-like isoform X2 [Carica papaya]|uniref:pyruvate decarboxylase 1-like isoform X2 n=1 Tax=Carica papaya TaxID=3649 RepID=UPI000B8C9B22|nr:pyruvate decarboxylase 1-like isoform X2 [Carica papaya]